MLKGKKSKFFRLTLITILGGYGWLVHATLHPPLPSEKTPLIFYTNHLRDDLKTVLFSAIEKALTSITLHIYGLTDPDLIALLQKKQQEGCEVTIFYDQKASSGLPSSLHAYPVQSGGLMHRKILILDHSQVIVGSANFTPSSLKIHGNLIVGIYNPDLAHFLEESSEVKKECELKEGKVTSYLLPDLEEEGLKQVKELIQKATSSIYIAMFTLTHPEIIETILEAKKRGVVIEMVVDRFTAHGASSKAIERLRKEGIEVWISQGEQLFHHKWALIDEKILIMGSANWTYAAFKTNQDCLFIFDQIPKNQGVKLRKMWKVIENGAKKE